MVGRPSSPAGHARGGISVSLLLRKLITWVTTLMVVASVLVTAPPSTRAAVAPMTEEEAVVLLRTYSIVRGSPGGQLDLDQPITRAQAAAVFVRVMGYEELSQALRDLVPFTDAKGHWAAGEIAMAERLGLMRGDGNGTFRPDSQITYAEMLTVLLRLVQQEPQGAWNPDTIFTAADRLGFAPRGAAARSTALRGKIFWSLASAITRVPLSTGETIIQRYIDRTPPTLTLDQSSVTTIDGTIQITGTARDAATVTVGGQKASLETSTGRFSATVQVAIGENTLTIEARDLAGNTATSQFVAERRAPIATLEIEGPSVIKTGTAVRLTVRARDSRGSEVPLQGLAGTVSNSSATFDASTLTLRAANTPGQGVLTLTAGNARRTFAFSIAGLSERAARLSITAVNGGVAPTVDKEFTVQVKVLDDSDRVVSDDYFRNIRLTATGLSGVTVSQSTVQTEAGAATFTVKGIQEGLVTLTATSSGLAEAQAQTQLLSSTRVVITTTPTTLRPDGATGARVTAVLQNESGRAVVNNTNSDIRITMGLTGTDTYFTDPYITIPRGQSTSSGDDAYIKSGLLAGTAVLRGTITSSHTYSVQGLSLPVTGTPAPVKVLVSTPTVSRLTPGAAPIDVTIQVLDASNRLVTWGSFSYRLRVTTSNNDPIMSNGLPEGVTLTYPGLTYGPVFDGNAQPAAVAGRTYQGMATVKLAYNKSGTVTITPELIPEHLEAYHPTIGLGPASSTRGLQTVGAQFLFAGTPTAIQLTADSLLGRDKPGAAIKAGGAVTVRARVVDANGAPVPGVTGNITLTRTNTVDLISRLNGTTTDSLTRPLSNGVAEFTIQGSSTGGFDVYSAAGVGLPASTLTVAVRTVKPITPAIVAVRGVKEGDPSPVVGYVAPDADYLDVQLAIQDPPNIDEPTYWVNARVTRLGETTPIVSDVMVNLTSSLPVVRIPKSLLRTGLSTYQVTINDGFGLSDPSPDLGLSDAVNAVYNTSYRLLNAYYDAATTKLYLATTGLPADGQMVKERLGITKGTIEVALGHEAVQVVSVSNSSVVLQLNEFSAAVNPDVFNGRVTITAQDGWFASKDGSLVARASNTAVLMPAAVITGGVLDKSTRTLTLSGSGLAQGPVALEKIRIGTVTLRPGTTSILDRLTETQDLRLTVALSQATYDAIIALPGAALTLSADVGWLRLTSGSLTYNAPALSDTNRQVQIAVSVNSASYDPTTNSLTISGRGFAGSTLDPSKLTFRRTTRRVNYTLKGTATATTVDDTTITLVLAPEDAAFFETTADGGFAGMQVFMNTEEGWLADAEGRMAAPITTDRVLFVVPAP